MKANEGLSTEQNPFPSVYVSHRVSKKLVERREKLRAKKRRDTRNKNEANEKREGEMK